MLKEKQMQEIQDLKLRGYSINEIVRYYEEKGQKPPSLPTILKYYQMDISRNTVAKYCEGCAVPWDRKVPKRETSVLTEEIVAFIQSCLDEDERENLKNSVILKRYAARTLPEGRIHR